MGTDPIRHSNCGTPHHATTLHHRMRAIAYDFKSPVVRIEGTMTAQRIMCGGRWHPLPSEVLNAFYQPDRARLRNALINQYALQGVQMLP